MEFSLENMCRTCMNEDGTMFSVFTMENRGISKICYADMLMACASLHVDRSDDLPQNICQHCLKQLSIAYSFKQQSERSEATLREITKNPDIEFIKEEIFEDTYGDLDDVPVNNDSIPEEEISLDDRRDNVSNEFKLTEEFLEDEFFVDENDEIKVPNPPFKELNSAIQKSEKKIKKEKIDFDDTNPLDMEFLEDEFILEYDEPESTNTQRTNKVTSEEFLEDNILVKDEMTAQQTEIEIKYDLETLRKAILKPKSSPVTSAINEYRIAQTARGKNSLDLDCLRKSVLTPKSYIVPGAELDRLKKSILTPKSKPGTHLLPRELKCPYCEQTFRTQAAFKKHKKQHTKKLKCELCLKEFRSTHGLRYHMKIHNGIKNYVCNFGDCTKRFRLKQALDKHLSIHNNEKNHLCALCGKTYSTYDALHYHLKAHRGERPYLCIHCGKTFKQSCHLKSHMWVHSGIKPHRCQRCGKCYTSGHQLKKHVNKHCPPLPTTAPSSGEEHVLLH